MRHLDEGRLQAWLDRPRSGIGAREAEEIARHLEECEACAGRLDELRQVDARADSILTSVGPEDDAVPAYREVVARSGRGGGDRRRTRRWVAVTWAASVVLALGAGWMTNELYRGERVALEPEVPAAAEGAGGAVADGDAAGADVARAEAGTDSANLGTVAAADPEAASEEAPAPAEQAQPAAPTATDTPEPVTLAEAPVVRGRVTDDQGRPVVSAQVALADGATGTLTDLDGGFTLEVPDSLAASDSGVPLTAERIGYATETRRVATAGADTVSADFRLREEALELQEVMVTGARARSADDDTVWRSVDRSTAEEEAGFAVRIVPGLEVLGVEVAERDGRPAVRVRQATPDGTQLTIVQRRAEGAAERAASARQVPFGSVDDTRVEMAEELPGFGGFYRDPDSGRFYVWITDLTEERASAAEAMVRDRLDRDDIEVTAREGQYDYRALLRWRRAIAEIPRDQVAITGWGIDERWNRLLIWVREEAEIAALTDRLRQLQIPEAAVRIRVASPEIDRSGDPRP